jgi:pyrroloquinoline quinone (PQQ) biosynthesis protein C
MAGLVPAIHVFRLWPQSKTWMPGPSPGMTTESVAPRVLKDRIAAWP